ncbi:hypothetical protein ACV3NL_04060 [Clostridium perfringens]|nr:hypothetical protein [Clostridium perfringens]MDK0602570.1 hypothetical protein [Clostridium perfringens]
MEELLKMSVEDFLKFLIKNVDTKTKSEKIIIYNPEGEIAYQFETIYEALKELKIYSERDLKYICKRNYVGNYSLKSKYRKFNGYKFTFA